MLLISGSLLKAQTTAPKIEPRLLLSNSRIQRGNVVRASFIIDVPTGYHLNAHDPMSKFALPSKIEVEVPNGMTVGPINYPKAISRRFGFSDEPLGVYEKRLVIRFRVAVPVNASSGSHEIKVRLRYQSCSNEVCFPPAEREAKASIIVS